MRGTPRERRSARGTDQSEEVPEGENAELEMEMVSKEDGGALRCPHSLLGDKSEKYNRLLAQ